jgi:TPR repeat protein
MDDAMMKTSKIKTVRNIGRIRTLLVTLSVAVCLATLMGCGYSPEKDTSPADDIEALRKKAEQGDADAQFNLGWMYADGKGVPEDYAKAVKWYRKGAEQGDARAQYNLGLIYNSGEGVPQDYAEAAKWFRKAAEQGYAAAQNKLGGMYCFGRGVAKDGDEAVKWCRKAAEQGLAGAQTNLGWMYATGEGVAKDIVAAYAWFRVGAASGEDVAGECRDSIKHDLTPSQLEKGQVMAREIYERIEKRKAAKARALRDSDAVAKKAQAPSKKTQAPTIRFGMRERYVSHKHQFSIYFPNIPVAIPLDSPSGSGTQLVSTRSRGDSSIEYSLAVMKNIQDEPPVRDPDVLEKLAVGVAKYLAQDGRIYLHRVVRFQDRFDAVYLKYPVRENGKDLIYQGYQFFTDDGTGRLFNLSIVYTHDLEQQATDRFNKFIKRFNYKP